MSYFFIAPAWLTLVIVTLTYIGVAIGRWPWLHTNRATIALMGAALLLAAGSLTLEEAYAALDLDTLLLLFSMMVLNANLRLAGFFGLVAARILPRARDPKWLLALLIGASGALSALFLNDTIVLMLTPLVVDMTRTLRRDPLPYLIGLATAANIGSVATITGNPQNMLIGISSGLSYLEFSAALLPVGLLGLLVAWLVIIFTYRSEFWNRPFEAPPESTSPVRVYRPLLTKATLIGAGMLLLFLTGTPVALAAFWAAALLLATRRVKPEKVFAEFDWSLLVFFSALFVVTGSLETSGLSERFFSLMAPIAEAGVGSLTLVTVILSNLISNVPAVLLFRPIVPALDNPTRAWLVLAMSSTLAGNLTLLGSVANLIVAESARQRGVTLSFRAYLIAGLPITLLTLLIGVWWLS